MDAIREKHKTLISGLTKLYDTLVAMHYISASDVCRPPHTSLAIDVARLQGLGFDAEVIDLVQLLPGLRHEVTWGYQTQGTQLVPRSKAVNYFAPPSEGAYLDLMDDVRNGDFAKWDEAKKLDPWLLRLTDGGDYGVHLIYDTRNQTIIEWTFIGNKYWHEIPSRPCDTVLSEILQKLQSLEWIPYYYPNDRDTPPSRVIEENPLIFQNIWPGGIRLPMDFQAALQELGQHIPDDVLPMRAQLNRWRALQKLYRDCGWGTEGAFDGEEFERRRLAFVTREKALEWKWIKHGGHPRPTDTEEQQRRRGEVNQEWDEFWRESAGEYSV